MSIASNTTAPKTNIIQPNQQPSVIKIAKVGNYGIAFAMAQFNLDVDNGRREPARPLYPTPNAACSVS